MWGHPSHFWKYFPEIDKNVVFEIVFQKCLLQCKIKFNFLGQKNNKMELTKKVAVISVSAFFLARSGIFEISVVTLTEL